MKKGKLVGLALGRLYKKMTKGQTSLFLETDEESARKILAALEAEHPDRRFLVYFVASKTDDVVTWQLVRK